MIVLVFGNPDVAMDSLPVRLLPALRAACSKIDFRHLDPNEEWTVPAKISIIDTVVNLDEPRVFESLAAFQSGPRLSMHDFDAYANLQLMMKIGRLRAVRVIGLPPDLDEATATEFCCQALADVA